VSLEVDTFEVEDYQVDGRIALDVDKKKVFGITE
jgi:hypothetical protein